MDRAVRLEFVVATYPVYAGRVALVRHKSLGRWLPPGGHIQPGETPDEAAVREVSEELGLIVRLVDESGDSRPGWTGEVLHLARPISVRREMIAPDHDHLDLVYAAIAESNGLKPNMLEVADGQWFSSRALESDAITPDVCAAARRALEVVSSCLQRVV